MVGQFLGVGFGHDLNEQGPAGEIALFDVLIEIALMAFTILGDNGFGFGVGQVFDACCVRKWNFTQKRSLFALMKLNVWLPNPCMWR
mgnify:CR=1 FL=1